MEEAGSMGWERLDTGPMMSQMLRCNAILFDLDGVLVDSKPVVERTWHGWAALRGVNVPDLVRRAHGRRSIETVRDVAPHLDAEAEVRWLANAELSDFDGVGALPGASSLLATLTDGEWAVVTSGGSELALRRLSHAGLPTPSILVAAEHIPVGKPAPDGYLLAARRLGLEPSDCAVIEDTPAGIQSGRAAGANVVALTTTFPQAFLADADALACTLADLRVHRTDKGLLLQIEVDKNHMPDPERHR
jgi:sugar-phosphatase